MKRFMLLVIASLMFPGCSLFKNTCWKIFKVPPTYGRRGKTKIIVHKCNKPIPKKYLR